MRVKMSDATLTEDRRIFERAVGHLGAAAETIALREARAILAETEPIGRGLFTAFVPVCGLDAVADLGAPMALAESLRSFVGDPCHCAQGLHWSPGRGYFHCAGVTPGA